MEKHCQFLHFFIGIIDAEGGGILTKGFTMFDNNVYDYLIGADLTCTELKIIMTIIRYTTGFHREECTLTASFISKLTKKTERCIEYSLKKLCERNLIVKKRKENSKMNLYSLGDFWCKEFRDDTENIFGTTPKEISDNKYNNINKNNYINKSRENYVPTPKATKFSNFENKHVIDYKRLEMEALQRRIRQNRNDSS